MVKNEVGGCLSNSNLYLMVKWDGRRFEREQVLLLLKRYLFHTQLSHQLLLLFEGGGGVPKKTNRRGFLVLTPTQKIGIYSQEGNLYLVSFRNHQTIQHQEGKGSILRIGTIALSNNILEENTPTTTTLTIYMIYK